MNELRTTVSAGNPRSGADKVSTSNTFVTKTDILDTQPKQHRPRIANNSHQPRRRNFWLGTRSCYVRLPFTFSALPQAYDQTNVRPCHVPTAVDHQPTWARWHSPARHRPSRLLRCQTWRCQPMLPTVLGADCDFSTTANITEESCRYENYVLLASWLQRSFGRYWRNQPCPHSPAVRLLGSFVDADAADPSASSGPVSGALVIAHAILLVFSRLETTAVTFWTNPAVFQECWE